MRVLSFSALCGCRFERFAREFRQATRLASFLGDVREGGMGEMEGWGEGRREEGRVEEGEEEEGREDTKGERKRDKQKIKKKWK